MNKSECDECINAWRTLYYSGLLSEKEAESIKKKINTNIARLKTKEGQALRTTSAAQNVNSNTSGMR